MWVWNIHNHFTTSPRLDPHPLDATTTTLTQKSSSRSDVVLVLTLRQGRAEWRDRKQRYGGRRVREQPYDIKCWDNWCVRATLCSGAIFSILIGKWIGARPDLVGPAPASGRKAIAGRWQEISFSVLEIIFKFFSAGTYKGSKRFGGGKFFPI